MRFRFLLVCAPILIVSCNDSVREHPEFESHFRDHHVGGSFLLYDLQNVAYTCYNPDRCKEEFIPASTFKILNSLVALETGAVQDENEIIPWDSVRRAVPAWNQDQDMKAAIRNSTVWFYQALARRIGETTMRDFITRVHYGNMNIDGGIDSFWLTGDLRISPMEQIEFLRRLQAEDLPFSPRTIRIVKRILIQEETPAYILRAKTGWGTQNGRDIGWYVGYVEQKGNVYFFATNIESANADERSFPAARTAITREILKRLGVGM